MKSARIGKRGSAVPETGAALLACGQKTIPGGLDL